MAKHQLNMSMFNVTIYRYAVRMCSLNNNQEKLPLKERG
mgnify:CR=1 FL=1